MSELIEIAGVFAYLSLMTVGGGMAAFPALEQLTVSTHHWLSLHELLHYYTMGQLVPGPNMMMVASVGARISGLPGAAVALLAFLLPTSLLVFTIGRLWERLGAWRWRPAIERSLGSVAVGLVLAGVVIMGRAVLERPIYLAMSLAVFVLLMRTKVNPALPILTCGAIGLGLQLIG